MTDSRYASVQVEREKLANDELLGRSMEERSSLERNVQRLNEENAEIRHELQMLQAHIDQLQNDHSQALVDDRWSVIILWLGNSSDGVIKMHSFGFLPFFSR